MASSDSDSSGASSRSSGSVSANSALEVGRVVLSSFSIVREKKIKEDVKELIGRDELQRIVKECKALYKQGKGKALYRTPSQTREIACNEIEPYLEKVNQRLASRYVPVAIVLDSTYSNFLSSHPTYFLSVLSA
uniref:Uncharacterized protein n=1 Tax=Mucochytrium quahogii TaxID=96639 RepID=A0A7S2S3F1_9STRA|mmetsp:Transcript_17324/g.27965  ORF Transcript_17324/g.27965 Transcript_17324/m.27965 type:complete len:134 (+) Transcript_17324:724-1125(+)|eukprot:CAMPEP_0203752240 /NCGR_PEP_ID=MMETSP0098-20131031/6184_1 /ASSEMBLY_ACC=CAM_ASM_000208 /TAXON_ID=96639 /ORGANISM=" , Strain NY0313808BC1" /LENGTH=133 /DNA_ID=CAMNT_0050642313 /DNA_START=433 /DNA_END=834 /DNA_ORIENTATION=-